MSEARAGRRDRALAAAIAGFAFALRLGFLLTSEDRAWPHSALYEGDAPVWARWAAALGRGEPFEFDLPLRTPGVAFLLHGLGFDAPPFTGAKVLWCALSALTCGALFLVASRWLSRRVAWIAAGLLAFSFGQYQLATSLNNEAPYALLLVVAVGLTLSWMRAPTIALSLALGALHGLALLLRAEHALAIAALTGFALVWRSREQAALGRFAARAALVAVAAVAVCLPWMLRSHAAVQRFNTQAAPLDYARTRPTWTPAARAFIERLPAFARAGNFAYCSALAQQAGKAQVDEPDVRAFFEKEWGYVPEPLGEWTLVSSKGALDFALANHPGAHGGFSRAALQDGRDPDPEFAFARPSHLRLYNHGGSIGWGWIRADFGAWLRAVGAKLARFADGATLGFGARNWPFGEGGTRRAVDMLVPEPAPGRQLLLLAGLATGAVLALRARERGLWLVPIACKLAVTVAFYGYARQAASIAPAFCVLLALCLDAGLELLGRRFPASAARAWIAGALAAAALLVVDALHAAHPPHFDVGLRSSDAHVTPAPQWGPGAFESVDELALRPRSVHATGAPAR